MLILRKRSATCARVQISLGTVTCTVVRAKAYKCNLLDLLRKFCVWIEGQEGIKCLVGANHKLQER